MNKKEILENICYTELVYGRINKKLNINFSKEKIEKFIYDILKKTEEKFFQKKGKNFYIINQKNNIRITINPNTFRIITVDKIKKYEKDLEREDNKFYLFNVMYPYIVEELDLDNFKDWPESEKKNFRKNHDNLLFENNPEIEWKEEKPKNLLEIFKLVSEKIKSINRIELSFEFFKKYSKDSETLHYNLQCFLESIYVYQERVKKIFDILIKIDKKNEKLYKKIKKNFLDSLDGLMKIRGKNIHDKFLHDGGIAQLDNNEFYLYLMKDLEKDLLKKIKKEKKIIFQNIIDDIYKLNKQIFSNKIFLERFKIIINK